MAKPTKKSKRKINVIKLILVAFVMSVFFSVFAIGAVYALGEVWTDETRLDMSESSIIYDASGNEVMKLFRQNRETLTLDKIPPLLVEAFIATEDQRFYEHHGVDPFSVARALVKVALAGEAVQGGSTITQQLAKNVFLSADKELSRKMKEAVISFTLERKYTKDQIMEMYLNYIYFGHGAYGVEAAADKYFDKTVDELTLAEMATLAALPKAPSNYSPFLDEDRAKQRRSVVLKLMEDQGYIKPEEREAAKEEPFVLNEEDFNKDKEFITYADYVIQEAVSLYGLSEDELYREGYHIYTHLLPNAQRAMEEVYANDDYFPESVDKQMVQSAMVIVDPKTGGITAMIGGRDYTQKSWNRAVKPRQPGSAFKPIAVYAPALENGWEPYSILTDEKIAFGKYRPENYNDRYQGKVTMIEAVKKSINIPAVWLLEQMGVNKGFAFAENLGFRLTPEDKNLSLALGGLHEGVTPLEMAQAYAAFNNEGIMQSSHAIIKITSKDGETLFEAAPTSKKVMSEQTAYYVTKMLETVVSDGGTGERAKLNRPTAGKTGTTQSGIKDANGNSVKGNRDAWFVGYSPELVAAVWVGYDKTDKDHLLSTGGGRVPATLFKAIMTEALKGRKAAEFIRPAGVERLERPIQLKAIADLSGGYEEEDRLIHLNWSALYPVEENKVGYKVFRKSEETGEFILIGDTLEPTWVDEPNVEGTFDDYYVVIYNLKTGEEGPPSNVLQVESPSESLLDLLLPGKQSPGDSSDGEGQGEGNSEGEGEGNGNGSTGEGEGSSEGSTGEPAGGTDGSGNDEGNASDGGTGNGESGGGNEGNNG
jgi:penicillin-binding protein 2A